MLSSPVEEVASGDLFYPGLSVCRPPTAGLFKEGGLPARGSCFESLTS